VGRSIIVSGGQVAPGHDKKAIVVRGAVSSLVTRCYDQSYPSWIPRWCKVTAERPAESTVKFEMEAGTPSFSPPSSHPLDICRPK
jgi:hypothetical protein